MEMDMLEIRTRLLCRTAAMPWSTLVRGSSRGPGPGGEPSIYFTGEEYGRIERAREALRGDVGKRIVVLDNGTENVDFSAEALLQQAEALKARTGVKRIIVVVDYLQIWPIPRGEEDRLKTDLDRDRWRVDSMNKLRRGLGPEGAVVVISEARKPTNEGDGWGTDMSDVMGSSRNTYSPSCVMLLTPASDSEIADRYGLDSGKNTKSRDAQLRLELAEHGIALTRLNIVKGRDGTQKGAIKLKCFFKTHRIVEGWDDLPDLKSARASTSASATAGPPAERASPATAKKSTLQ